MSLYLEHFGLRDAPFRITPQTAWFYAGARRGALLDALLYAIGHDEGIIKISGEVGTGKTMLCRMLIERLPDTVQVVYLANPSLAPEALLATIALELDLPETPHLTVLRAIEQTLIARYAEGRRVVVIIDEAHAMPRESLEQIRLLSNLESPERKLLQLVLFGQPELDELLEQRELRSLKDRITQHFSLGPLGNSEVFEYLRHRLEAAGYRGPDLFSRRQAALIGHAARGLTRRVNILADKALLAAFAEKTRNLSARHIRQAAADARYALPPVRRVGLPLVAGTCTVLAVAALGLLWRPGAGPKSPAESGSPATPIAHRAAPPASAPTPSPLPPPVNTHASTASTDGLGPLSSGLLNTSRPMILAARPDQHFVQIQRVSAADAASLEDFLHRMQRAVDPSQLRLYAARADGRLRYGIIFGEFADARAAAAAIAAMPAWLRELGIYPRPYSAIQAAVAAN